MPNRILFVSYTADWTGPTNSLMLLLKHLRTRYDVAVLLPGQGLFSERLESENITSFSFDSLGKWSIPAVVRLIRQERFSLVYANNHSGSSRNALIAAKLRGIPFVCHIRELARRGSWRSYFYLRLADAVIPVSLASADYLGRRIHKNLLHVVHNGIDISYLYRYTSRTRGALRQELDIEGQGPLIIYVGHIKPLKGQEYAVRAVAEVERSGVDLTLLLVGHTNRDKDYAEYVQTLADEYDLGRKIRMMGFRQDAIELLALADIYIHTSLEEAHPRAILEAMAMGLPVVAFAVGGVLETVVDGLTGYLVRPGDELHLAEKIAELASDPALRARMGNAGRKRVEDHFKASEAAEKVAEIIDGVLFQKQPSGSLRFHSDA